MEKMLPGNLEAERGLLASILLDPMCFDQVADSITPPDFTRNAHSLIYTAMLALSAKGIGIDQITLAEELDRTGKLKDAGDYGYLVDLMTELGTPGMVPQYAAIISKNAMLRRIIHAAGQIAAVAYEQEDNAYDKAEQILLSIQKTSARSLFSPLSEVMTEYIEELNFLHSNRGSIIGVPTGYSDLDNTLGGLQRSDLILLAARPSMGKTSLALCIGYNAALRGKKVAVFSLEMGKRLLARRLMSMSSKIDMQRLRNGWIEDDEWDTIMASANDLSTLPLWINDAAGNPIASMRSQLRRLNQEQKGIDLVIVDYLGLIEPDTDSAKRENLVQQISAISRGLKTLAREFDVPVMALCQLSRAVESRSSKIPLPSDLRDSGSLEQDADVVMFIYRDDYYAKLEGRESERPNIADLYIAKHRNGPTGVVSLYFQANQTMFYPLEITSAVED
jgi:replicative DNA helicase